MEERGKLLKKLSSKNINEIKNFDELIENDQYLVVKNEDIGAYLADVDAQDYEPKLLTFISQTGDKVRFLDNGSQISFDKEIDLKDENNKINIWEIPLPGDQMKYIFGFLEKHKPPKGEGKKGGRKSKSKKGGKRKKNRKSRKSKKN